MEQREVHYKKVYRHWEMYVLLNYVICNAWPETNIIAKGLSSSLAIKCNKYKGQMVL